MIGIKFNQFQQKDNYLSPQNEKTTVYADRPGTDLARLNLSIGS